MFLQYKKSQKVINLDNFDEIAMQTECYNKHHIVARKYCPSPSSSSKSEAMLQIIIQTFADENRAAVSYELLKREWLNGAKVFDID